MDSRARRLRELALLFLRLGTTAFGGPAAHIAMMEDELVRRRRWLTREHFLDLLGATNLVPGPNSTELAIHIGRLRAGFAGLVVAGACFILPAALIVSGIAWAYVRGGSIPAVGAVLYGVKPVVLAVVLQALWGLGRSALKTRTLALVGVAAAGASLLGVDELLLLLLAGALVAAVARLRPGAAHGLAPLLPLAAATAPAAALAAPAPLSIFLNFAKIGSVLYGSGYVLLAFMRAEFVERLRWMTEGQLLDAIAVGQVTPGPVFTTATFVGWILSGPWGALAATAGIFLPAFFFVAISGPLVPRLRASPTAGAFLDGVNAASLALMAAVTLQLANDALVDPWTVALLVASAVALLKFRVNSAWLVLAGAAAGVLARALAGRA